jgi:hypothetical protein
MISGQTVMSSRKRREETSLNLFRRGELKQDIFDMRFDLAP